MNRAPGLIATAERLDGSRAIDDVSEFFGVEQLTELCRKIECGTENVALADIRKLRDAISRIVANGLLPGLLDFIARAKSSGYGLRAAFCELKWPAVLQPFKAAKAAGAAVKIVYHGKADDNGKANEQAIDGAEIRFLCISRENAKLMHNKFIVLTKSGSPVSVSTGSTNLSRNALHGQLNVGHAINDRKFADAFLKYWTALKGDPESADLKNWVETEDPIPPEDESEAIMPVFSPHRGKGVFDGGWNRQTRPAGRFS